MAVVIGHSSSQHFTLACGISLCMNSMAMPFPFPLDLLSSYLLGLTEDDSSAKHSPLPQRRLLLDSSVSKVKIKAATVYTAYRVPTALH